MKKLLIAFSMIGAGALIACATDNGTPTTESIDWFKVTTAETTGGAIVAPEGTSWIINGEKFEVESDLDNLDTLVSFTPGTQLTQKMAQVSFTLDAAIMPDELPDLDEKKAKLAFAINQSGFNAWIGTSGWIGLSGADVPAEGESFDLLVEFDNREAGAQKVRFSVNETVLKDKDDAEWISYSEAVAAGMKVGFAGSGMITSFEGDQIKVTAEIIPVGDGTITIKEEDLEKFKVPEGSTYTRDQFIAAPAKEAFGSSFATENITVGEAYALGLVADNGTGTMRPVNGGVLKAKAIAQSGSSDGVKLDLEVNPPEGTGATITYNILKDNAEYKKDLSKDQLIIPTKDLGVGLKVFKIQAIVTPAPLN